MKKVISILIVLTMLLSVLSGCAGNEEPAESIEPGEQEPVDEEIVDTEDDISDNTLVWNNGPEPGTIDPGLNEGADGGSIIENLYEGLMVDYRDGLDYGCAESYEVLQDENGDDTIYEFKLKEGLKWSDGEPLTAHDFEYSWKRVCDPKTASGASYIISPYIKGGDEYLNGEGTRDEVGISCPDDYTLRVELNFPVPYFPELTTMYTYLPVREDVVEAHGDGWEKKPEVAVSNGPFKLAEYATGSHIMLEKNEHYYDADEVHLDKIKVLMIVEETTALNAYENGEIQILKSVPLDEIPRLRAEDPNFNTASRVGTYYVLFNTDEEPTNDLNVRKALSLAIDNKQIVEQVTKAGELPATGFVPASLKFSTNESFRKLDEDGMPMPEYGKDPNRAQVEEAQALLAEAGYPNGEGFPEVVYVHDTGEAHKMIGEALQEMWKTNLNIDVSLRNEEWATLLQSRKLGDYNMARGGWLGDFADPMTLLEVFTSYNSWNEAQWRWNEQPIVAPHDKVLNPENKDYDDAVTGAQYSSGTERDEYLLAAEAVLMDNQVISPIYYYVFTTLVDESKVEGVQLATMGQWIFKHAKMVK